MDVPAAGTEGLNAGFAVETLDDSVDVSLGTDAESESVGDFAGDVGDLVDEVLVFGLDFVVEDFLQEFLVDFVGVEDVFVIPAVVRVGINVFVFDFGDFLGDSVDAPPVVFLEGFLLVPAESAAFVGVFGDVGVPGGLVSDFEVVIPLGVLAIPFAG